MSNKSLFKIGLLGRMRSGKDTVGQMLIKKLGIKRYSFGDVIKETTHLLFPHIPLEPKPRTLYIDMDTKMRELDPDVWVRLTMNNVKKEKDILGIVFTSARRTNECDALKNEGFILVKVHASEEIRKHRLKESGEVYKEEDFYHETELIADTYPNDFVITNEGTLEELERQVDIFIANLQSISQKYE